jgi:hypothetical protein
MHLRALSYSNTNKDLVNYPQVIHKIYSQAFALRHATRTLNIQIKIY